MSKSKQFELRSHKNIHLIQSIVFLQIARQLSALLLIDDSIENSLDCATAHPPVPCLLYGQYPWNRYVSSQSSPTDMLAHAERVDRGIDSEEGEKLAGKLGWSGEDIGQALPECVRRVRDWKDVVEFVKRSEAEAKLGEGKASL